MAVLKFDVGKRRPFADGRSFGETGGYEHITGTLTYSADPGADVNQPVVDLQLAPRGDDGCIHFSGDISLVVPVDRSRSNGTVIVDVPNRGRPLLGRFLNAAGEASLEDPFHPGDGFLFKRGFSMATVGWQFDVQPAPNQHFLAPPVLQGVRGQIMADLRADKPTDTMSLTQLGSVPYRPAEPNDPSARLLLQDERGDGFTEIDRSRWQLLTPDGKEGTPLAVVAKLDGGFEPGRTYTVVYEGTDPPLSGASFLALRDAASFLRSGSCEFVPDGFKNTLAVGVSQTGRVLRHMLSLGLNLDESGKKAIDGTFIAIAGGSRGQFNQRFAQPSVMGAVTLGAGFPFADAITKDPHGDLSAGVFDAAKANGSMPKVVATNTSWEYWRGDASLSHVTADGVSDLEMDANIRSYLITGTQHAGGGLPQLRTMPLQEFKSAYGFNVVDYRPVMRAAFLNLADWVADGVEPPPSAVPHVADGTAVTRDSVLPRFAAGLGIDVLDPTQLETKRGADFGPDADKGLGVYPPVLGGPYTGLVPNIDTDFNDVSGIRLPDLTVPVGTHTGWNPRDTATGSPGRAVPFAGFSRFFAPTAAEKDANDPRPSIAERYPDKEAYLALVRKEAEALVRDRHVLREDVDWVVENCGKRYDVALKTGTRIPD